MSKITVKIEKEVEVKKVRGEMGVRYWEDGTVNGVEDKNGDLIPLRADDDWDITVDVETGKIENWPYGTIASVHYKICDNGEYWLLDEKDDVIYGYQGYVPSIFAPCGESYGDYAIMEIEQDGTIKNWKVDFSDFESEMEND